MGTDLQVYVSKVCVNSCAACYTRRHTAFVIVACLVMLLAVLPPVGTVTTQSLNFTENSISWFLLDPVPLMDSLVGRDMLPGHLLTVARKGLEQ